jgi:nitrite reductase/ring-hydroxylating ferredoxin subunit
MAAIDHWHPVLLESQLGKEPVGIRLCGRSIVLFRGGSGQIGALEDICPHRRMRLSLGKVCGDRLQCCYHGWSFDTHGAGMSPGTPRLTATATSFDVRQAYGAIWVKPQGCRAAFPEIDSEGYQAMRPLAHRVKARLEPVLDNFCEIEHTSTTHKVFGYPLESMEKVSVQFFPQVDRVRVVNHGPAKPLSLPHRLLLGINRRYRFDDEWTTYFSPVYSIYDHWWSDPNTKQVSKIRWRMAIAISPLDDQEMKIFTFPFLKSTYVLFPDWVVRCFHGYLRRFIDMEIKLDVRVLQGLASQDPSLSGMKLSRFDRVLGLNRERIDRIYRGISSRTHLNGETVQVDACADRTHTECCGPA